MGNKPGDPVLDGQETILLKESTTPTPLAAHGQIYTKSDQRMYFQDGAGNEIEIVIAGVQFIDMFFTDNGTATPITTVDDPVALEGFAVSHATDFTVVASKNGDITDTANNGGILRITDVAHGLITGDIVTINGLATAAQNGITVITRIDDDNFDCDDISFVTIDETGTWEMGTYILTPTGGAGNYLIMFGSSATSAGANKTYLVNLVIGTTLQTDAKVERKYTAADIGSVMFSGIVSLADADRLWVCVTGLTDATDITFKHANLSLHRL